MDVTDQAYQKNFGMAVNDVMLQFFLKISEHSQFHVLLGVFS